MVELNALAKEQLEQGFGPYVVVALQECTRMNTLLLEIEVSVVPHALIVCEKYALFFFLSICAVA